MDQWRFVVVERRWRSKRMDWIEGGGFVVKLWWFEVVRVVRVVERSC
jgi:hypothetical protein